MGIRWGALSLDAAEMLVRLRDAVVLMESDSGMGRGRSSGAGVLIDKGSASLPLAVGVALEPPAVSVDGRGRSGGGGVLEGRPSGSAVRGSRTLSGVASLLPRSDSVISSLTGGGGVASASLRGDGTEAGTAPAGVLRFFLRGLVWKMLSSRLRSRGPSRLGAMFPLKQ